MLIKFRSLVIYALQKFNCLFGSIISLISNARLIPHIIHYLSESDDCDLNKDIEIWKKYYSFVNWNMPDVFVFMRLMKLYPEFRNVFYYRARWHGGIFEFLCPPVSTLYLYANSIGPGLFISHGFSSIVAAKSIGKNFYLHQQVTIGWKNNDNPIIGDNVQVGAGSIVLGGITLGNNSIVGAGATVVKDVQESTIVVGNPAYSLKRKG